MHKRLMFQFCLMAVLALAAQAAQPLGHWPFDGHLDDMAGAANGTFAGGAPAYVPGRINQALRFDGVDDYVAVMVENLTAYTITAWVLPERTDSAGIVTRTSASGTVTHWSHQLRIDVSGRFEHYLYDGNMRNVVGTTQIEPGNWYFVAVSAADNGNLRLYVNGQEEGSAVALGMLWSGGDRFHIGSNSGGGPGWFQGVIDDVRVYDQELTEAEQAAMIAAAPFPFAFSPQPKNGAMLEQTSVVLRWNKGDSALAHDVYVSESFADVNEGTAAAIRTTDTRLSVGSSGGPFPAGLVPGRTYYWRVNEINESHPDSPWKGPVWSFWLPPLTAWSPVPATGATYVDPDQDLTWRKGLATLFHTIYFGESFDEVSTAATGGAMKPDPIFDTGPLAPGQTYYWRVDEFAPTGTHKGEVWSFTTRPVIAVTDDPNLMLWWTLDEGPGAAGAADWSGRGRHGTPVNAFPWTPDGYHGGALTFDGKSYLYSLTAPALPSQTVCAWVKTLQAPASILGWANAQPTSGTHDKTLYINADRTVSWYIWDGAAKLVTSTQPVSDGTWHHVAGVYTSGQTMQLYVDGVLQGSTEVVDIFAGYTAPHLTVGIESHAGRYLDGVIDDVHVYNKVLSEEQLQQLMRGDPLAAWNPAPARGAIVDIRAVDSLGWSAGEGAASHDMYFGRDRTAVAAADKNAPQFQGNRKVTSLSLAGLVEFGGGDYYWRIDEVESDGTVHAGNIWKFTVPDYLVVDDFESYNDDEGKGTRIYETWIDGWTAATKNGSTVGNWDPPFAERIIVHGGTQSMPFDYNNVNAPYYSEAVRTWETAQDWTAHGVTTLTLYLQGRARNDASQGFYVALENQGKAPVVVTHPDPAVLTATKWVEWQIPLSEFAGVNLAKIKAVYVGVGDRQSPKPGGGGLLYIDDLRLIRP